MMDTHSEILCRLVRFLDMDEDGLRRLVLSFMLESGQFTVEHIYERACCQVQVSKKTIASMIGYICSRMGILHSSKTSYRSPIRYTLKDEYIEVAKSALARTA